MKFVVTFQEDITTRRMVYAIVEADSENDVEEAIKEGNYEVDDVNDCYDTDWELVNITSIEQYDENVDD